jgi:hypothetical protein
MEYGFIAYTGKEFAPMWVDTYNRLTREIEGKLAHYGPDYDVDGLLNERHRHFQCCALLED